MVACEKPAAQTAPNFFRDTDYMGVAHSRAYLAIDHRLPDTPQEYEQFLMGCVDAADRPLVREAILLDVGDKSEHLKRIASPEICEEATRDCCRAAYETVRDHPRISVLYPVAGALPLSKRISELGLEQDRWAALEINGTQGATTGEAKVKTPLPLAMLNPHYSVLIVDNIGDTFVSAAVVAIERRKYRMNGNGDGFEGRSWEDFLKKLKGASKNPKEDRLTYQMLTGLLQEEQVFVLPVFSKNANAIAAIADLADKTKDRNNSNWGSIQAELFDRYLPYALPPDEWVLGAGLSDVGIRLEDVVAQLPAELRNHPMMAAWKGRNVLLRLGVSIPGLVSIEPEQVDWMTALLAQKIAEKLPQSPK